MCTAITVKFIGEECLLTVLYYTERITGYSCIYAFQLLHSEVNNFLRQVHEIIKRDTIVKYIFLTAACVSVVP